MKIAERPDTHRAILFWATVVFAIPALITYGCAVGLRDGADLLLPGLWFVYSASRIVATMGVLLSVGLVGASLIQHSVTGKVLFLAGLSVAGTIFLLWYSASIGGIVR